MWNTQHNHSNETIWGPGRRVQMNIAFNKIKTDVLQVRCKNRITSIRVNHTSRKRPVEPNDTFLAFSTFAFLYYKFIMKLMPHLCNKSI